MASDAISTLLAGIDDPSWSTIKKAAKVAMLQAAVGGVAVMQVGTNVQRLNIDQLKKLYELADQMTADEASAETGGGIALVQYGERV
jgi:hypothetical protein